MPLTTAPTRDVLRRMPTDLIVAVMDEGVQRHITFAVWDFAGQRIYYSVHHLFITRGVYVVVFSLEDAAHDMAGCLEYLAFWLHSVHAHTADASDYCVLLVGTHSDVVHEAAEQARISERIEAAFEGCGFWPQIEQPGVQEGCGEGHGVCYFPIDNTRPVQERADDVWSRRLHERINTLGQQLVERKNNSYPVRWLQIYDELQQRADDGANFVVLGTSNAEQQFGWSAGGERGLYPIARAYGIRPGGAEYQTVCAFLEEVGAFLRFHDLLILRPQWIADTLFAVVTRPQFRSAHVCNPNDGQGNPQQEPATELMREWRAFEAGAVAGETLLARLWSNAEEDPPLLTALMVHFDLMLELPAARRGSTTRAFLVPSMLPPYRANTSTWTPLTGAEPACYLVFGQKNSDEVELLTVNHESGATRVSDRVHGFIPEGLWFKLLVRCARWSQHTDSEWCAQHLTRSVRRDRARFSFGAQQFELRLHRAEHAVRLLVLGGCGQYPLGVLRRVRDIVDATLKEHFPRLHYFVALRVSVRCCDGGGGVHKPTTRLVDLEAAIGQVRRREFGSTESARSVSLDSVDSLDSLSSLVAVSRDDIDTMDVDPWCPPEEQHDRRFDVYLSHAEADTEFALKLYDCFGKCNTPSGDRVRVFMRGVTLGHVAGLITPQAALGASTLFVPVVSRRALAACSGNQGGRRRQLRAYAVWGLRLVALAMTAVQFVMHLLLAHKLAAKWRPHQPSDDWQPSLFVAGIVVPRLVNVVLLTRMLTVELHGHRQFVAWLRLHKSAFAVMFALSVLRLDNFSLLTSGLFELSACQAPIPQPTCNRLSASGVVQNVLGDLPQLVVALYLNPWRDWAALGTAVSNVFSLLYQLADRLLTIVLLRECQDPVQAPCAVEDELLFDWMLATELMHASHGSGAHADGGAVATGSATEPLLSPTDGVSDSAADSSCTGPRALLPLVIDECGSRREGEGVPVPDSVLQMLDNARVLFPHLQRARRRRTRSRKRRGDDGRSESIGAKGAQTVGDVVGSILESDDCIGLQPAAAARGGRGDLGSIQTYQDEGSDVSEWTKYEAASSRIASALSF